MALDETVPLADDTKINIEGAKFDKSKDAVHVDVGQKMIGLTKEELEHFKNDPCWKRIRLFLFALFWLLWAAMFIGAILIVVVSPKCAEKQQPKWWQTKVSYQVLTPTFYDSKGDGVGTIEGITQKIDLLRKIGVTTVYPSPVLTVQKDDFFDAQAVIDHEHVDPRFGTNDDLKKLIEAAHDRDMYVVLDMPLTSVSKDHPWMQNLSLKNDDAFIWKTVTEGNTLPLGFYDAPSRGGAKYLGYPDAAHPVLNWKSDKVKNYIMGAIRNLIELGVDGFNLDHVSRLAVDADGVSQPHEALQKLAEITADIRAFQKSKPELAEKEIVLFSSMQDMEDEMHARVIDSKDLMYTINNIFARITPVNCGMYIAKCVHDQLTAAADRFEFGSGFTPFWQFSNAQKSRLASRFDADTANLLTFTQLTLPGAMSLYYGQELGLKDGVGATGSIPQAGVMQWEPKGDDHHGFSKFAGKLFFAETEGGDGASDNFESQYAEENSPLKVYQKLAKLRQRDEVMIIGKMKRDVVKGNVVVFSRYVPAEDPEAAAGAAYVVVLNFGAEEAAIDLNSLGAGVLPKGKTLNAAEITAVTPGVTGLRARDKYDLSATALKVPGKQGILLRV